MDYPKFTVVTPTYNQGHFIEKTIDSVLSQGYPNLEYIIIDGGSKDNTVETIKKYERHLSYWVSEPDRGQCHAINKGMSIATGHYVAWLNSDDWYLPSALNNMHEAFIKKPGAGMTIGAGRMVDNTGKVLRSLQPPNEVTLESLYNWLNGKDFLQPSCAFTRSAWASVGGLDEKIHIALDVDLWFRMAKSGIKFATTETVISEALIHPDAKTTAYEDLMLLDCSLVIIKHGGEHIARKTLEDLVNRYSWYRRNYETITRNPILRMMRPLIKRFSKPGEYWNDIVPPWAKGW